MLNWKGLEIKAEGEGISTPLSKQVNLLGTLLGHAIRELAGEEIFNLTESFRLRLKESYEPNKEHLRQEVIEDMKKLNNREIDWLLRSFTSFFHLINKAEQQEIIRINRSREKSLKRGDARPDSILESIYYIKELGFTLDEADSLINSLDIQPTLTAHPTEARRRSILYIQKQIADSLAQLSLGDLTKIEEQNVITSIYNYIVLLLNTDDVRSTKITVRDEVKNGLYFFISTIWELVPDVTIDVEDSIEVVYNAPVKLSAPVKYRTWIGGDRDGNPKVTTDVTRFALLEQRNTAVELYKRSLINLRRELSLSDRQTNVPEYFRQNVMDEVEKLNLSEGITSTYQHELYRLKINCILEKLNSAILVSDDNLLQINPDGYTTDEFKMDMELIRKSLIDSGYRQIAEKGLLRRILSQINAFGLSLTALDIRQHSAVFGSTVDELLRHASVSRNYLGLKEEQKVDILMQELSNPRPLVPINSTISDESKALLTSLNLVRKAILMDSSTIGSLIISMTHHVSHMLEAVLLCKETGLWQYNEGNVSSMLDVVPLFETIDDLERSHILMEELFNNPIYEMQLKARGHFQEIMLGYSDSNKDGGYWMANWALHKAQKNLARVSALNNINLRLFHGRGGTVGRGGGRANQAVIALPPDCHNGKIRFTEQGEVISFRYANKLIAKRHLEQVVNAMVKSTANYKRNLHLKKAAPEEIYEKVMEKISKSSMESYRGLINRKDFWPWYISVTPIEHISHLPIASRPISRKSSNEVDFDSLRAIPWVFAWTQVRYNVPGWYGIGSAFNEAISSGEISVSEVQKLFNEWDFFKAIVNNAQREMGRASLTTSEIYGQILPSPIHKQICDEFDRSRDIITTICESKELLENIEVIQKSIQLRNPYTDVLNLLQFEMMLRWNKGGEQDRDSLKNLLFTSINGVAAAMQSTG
jgi:phosphoenolpyruvate carboxylase